MSREELHEVFVDSANLAEIEDAVERGFPSGITTNPSILSNDEKGDFREHIKKIIRLLEKHGYDIPLSVEVFSTNPAEMMAFCQPFFTWYNTEHGHGSIGLLTPAMVHNGHAEVVRARRAEVLAAAYAAHPERFVRQPPQPPLLPPAVRINPPAPSTIAPVEGLPGRSGAAVILQ